MKFFKNIATIVLSSVVLFSVSAHAQDKFGIKEGSYTGELISEKTDRVLVMGYAQIVIEKDGTGSYLQSSLVKQCYKGELKLSQKRDPSGQLIFEIKPNSAKEKCPNLYYFVKKTQGMFTTHFVAMHSNGNYVRVNDSVGHWVKD